MLPGRLIILLLACAGLHLRAEGFPEYKVKAAFLFNFLKFTEFPKSAFATADQPINVVVLGADPFGETLEDTFKGKQIAGRRVVISRETNSSRIPVVHLLFIARSEEGKLPQITELFRGRPVITVSEIPGFAKNDGMVEIKVIDQQVAFDLNDLLARQAGLVMHPQMVRIARTVYR